LFVQKYSSLSLNITLYTVESDALQNSARAVINLQQDLTMSVVDILITLPTSLSCTILRDWLYLKYVVALDSAYCCKAKRTFFEDLWQSVEYFVGEKIILAMYSTIKHEVLHGLPKLGSKLRSIEFNDKLSSAHASSIALHCRNLTSVTYIGFRYIPGLWDIIRNNTQIAFLSLSIYSNGVTTYTTRVSGLSLPNLTRLALLGNSIDHVHIVDIFSIISNIAYLNLEGANVNMPTLLQILQLCPHIASLGLGGLPLSDDDIRQLTAVSPRIRHLDIEGISTVEGITDIGILAIVQNLTGLQSLNMKDNDICTHASLVHIYTHCANTLHTLHLEGNYSLGEEYVRSMNTLFERCSRLRTLNFDYYTNNVIFTTKFVLPESTLSNMHELKLSGDIVSDHNLSDIAKYGINLHTLAISNARQYSDSTVRALYEGCPKLRELYIHATCTWPNASYDQSYLFELMKSRPGMVVGSTFPVRLYQFDVLCVHTI